MGIYKMIYVKNFKFINGCEANKDTHKTAKIFLTSNIYGTYIIAVLCVSLLALQPLINVKLFFTLILLFF